MFCICFCVHDRQKRLRPPKLSPWLRTPLHGAVYSLIAFDERVSFWLQRARLLPLVCLCCIVCVCDCVIVIREPHVQLMIHTHTHKAVTVSVEAKKSKNILFINFRNKDLMESNRYRLSTSYRSQQPYCFFPKLGDFDYFTGEKQTNLEDWAYFCLIKIGLLWSHLLRVKKPICHGLVLGSFGNTAHITSGSVPTIAVLLAWGMFILM